MTIFRSRTMTTTTLAALSLACITVIYLMLTLFQSDHKPWADAAVMWLPLWIAAAPPYAFVLWRLIRNPGDSLGLGVGMVSAAVAVMFLVGYAIAIATVKEQPALNFFTAVVLFHVTGAVAVLVFIPLQVRFILAAIKSLGSSGTLSGALAIGTLSVALYVLAARTLIRPLNEHAVIVAKRSEYSDETARTYLGKLYRCLWRLAGPGAVNGFPASDMELRALGDDCWDPVNGPDGTGYGAHYDFRYQPGPRDADGRVRSFSLATRKRTARWARTESYYLDQEGLLRRSATDWASGRTRAIVSFSARLIPTTMALLDVYHELHGRYPQRILHPSEKESAGPDDLVMPAEYLGRAITRGPGNSSILDYPVGTVTYRPAATSYTLGIRSAYDEVRNFRSYLVDADGRVYGTGQARDALASDPVAPDPDWPPGARESARARARLALQR